MACTALEFLRSLTSPFGTYSSVAGTQNGNLTLMQLVSVTCVWGMGFLVLWFGAVITWAWDCKFEMEADTLWPERLFCSARNSFKIWQRSPGLHPNQGGQGSCGNPTKRVANPLQSQQSRAWIRRLSGQPGLSQSEQDSLRSYFDTSNGDMLQRSRFAAQAGAKIIFWSEGSGLALKPDEVRLIEHGRGLARQERVYLGMAYRSGTQGKCRSAITKSF